jgi:hypothetical protein
LKAQETSLKAHDAELKNDIARWNDKSYVVAQARENLGFVFPGETSIMIVNPQAVEGSGSQSAKQNDKIVSLPSSLPWYSELAYSFGQADKGLTTE